MTEWHVPTDELVRYASGDASGIGLASIESHVVTCGTCRDSLTTIVRHDARAIDRAGDQADAVWAGVVARVDNGRRAFAHSSRLWQVSLSSPPLALVTVLLAALLVAAVGLTTIADTGDATALLVVAAPLVPLVTARLAFVDRIDPAGRIAAAVPIGGSRVAALRALVSAAIACVAGLAVTPLTSLSALDSLAWLLPALAGCAVAVAIGTFVDSTIPTGAFALGWVLVTAAWLRAAPAGARGESIDGLVSGRSSVQLALALVAGVAVAVALANRDSRPAIWSARRWSA